MSLVWNVKHVVNVSQAVSSMRHGSPSCTVSPSCDTKRLPFGRTIGQRRRLKSALEELNALASDEYYLAHGLGDYNAKCAELFEVKQRRGYVQLIMKDLEEEKP